MVSDSVGKQMTLREAMERVDLKGRRVLLATGRIDPYYLSFLAKEALIVTTKGNLAAKATPLRVEIPAIVPNTPPFTALPW